MRPRQGIDGRLKLHTAAEPMSIHAVDKNAKRQPRVTFPCPALPPRKLQLHLMRPAVCADDGHAALTTPRKVTLAFRSGVKSSMQAPQLGRLRGFDA